MIQQLPHWVKPHVYTLNTLKIESQFDLVRLQDILLGVTQEIHHAHVFNLTYYGSEIELYDVYVEEFSDNNEGCKSTSEHVQMPWLYATNVRLYPGNIVDMQYRTPNSIINSMTNDYNFFLQTVQHDLLDENDSWFFIPECPEVQEAYLEANAIVYKIIRDAAQKRDWDMYKQYPITVVDMSVYDTPITLTPNLEESFILYIK